MNSIPTLQNSAPFLHLLRARSQVYADAVRLQLLQLLLTVVVPVLGALIGLLASEARPYIAALALMITVADVSWLDRSQRRKLKLLEMPWNKLAAGKAVGPETIERAARAWHQGDTKLINWYPPSIGKAPLHLGRVVCQRTNIWYDGELRRRYGSLLVWFVVGVFAAFLIAGIAVGLSLLDFVAVILTPAAPALIWAIRDCFRQRDAADALETIRGEAESLWENVIAGDCTEDDCKARSREFQNAIYVQRATNPLVFPFIYKCLRTEMETQMNVGATQLLEKAGMAD